MHPKFVVVILSYSHVQLLGTPWTSACQAPLSSSISQSLLKLVSIESLVLSNHLILTLCFPIDCRPQAFMSFTISWSLLKLMSIKLMMLSNHLILCCPCLLLPSIFPTIRVFSSELTLHIRWPKYWSFSFSISPSNEYSGLISNYIQKSCLQI